MSQDALDELMGVMARKHFEVTRRTHRDAIEYFLKQVREASIFLVIIPEIPVFERDPKDTVFLALALTGNADAIISGDKDLRDLGEYQGIPILSAREFLDLLDTPAAP